MSRSVLDMSMSLDGDIAGPEDNPRNPGGDNFMRLHEWFGFVSEPGPTAESIDPSGIARQFLDRSERPARSSRVATRRNGRNIGAVITTTAS
jgi:hypothetical protein